MTEYAWIDCGDGRSVFRKVETRPEPQRSSLPAPMIISDTMEPTQSMVDGTWHTSKAGIRATYKPSGNKDGKEYVEVGNDPARMRPRQKPKKDRQAIKNSIERAKARFNRGERLSKVG